MSIPKKKNRLARNVALFAPFLNAFKRLKFSDFCITIEIMNAEKNAVLFAGIDVGSTTTKLAVWDCAAQKLIYSQYKRHHAHQKKSVLTALEELRARFGGAEIRIAMTGSGAKPVALELDLPFVQEVVANSIALKKFYPQVNTAIELGGQDAKMIFFSREENSTEKNSSEPKLVDMRMNGSCAGGTGAFIDEVASILKTPIEEFDALSQKGNCVYDISGRCGVYAKTDIQPLLNSGTAKADIALSAFHAIAKQTIGGLAQGLEINPPVAFEGGPLTFNTQLVRVFEERLGLEAGDSVLPEHSETMVALGAALSISDLFKNFEQKNSLDDLISILQNSLSQNSSSKSCESMEEGERTSSKPFFDSEEEKNSFFERHAKKRPKVYSFAPGESVRAYLGIDSGSTTTKFVLLDEDEKIIDYFYSSNEGDPLLVAKKALIKMRERYKAQGVHLEILGAGSTGYGELLFNKAFDTECHVVETVAHAAAASHFVGDVDFLLDIGGQDMKAIWLSGGIITNILVNEACSSGCGSFLQNFADSLGIKVEDIAATAFNSKNPAVLGSRCTVFMTSSIVTEQRNGKLPEDIMAGLCRSIIQNVFTKVIRVSNIESLGRRIVVQGGTFQNDAVLRAMEEYTGRQVIRAPYPGIMGAIGAALLTKEKLTNLNSAQVPRTFIGLEALDEFSYTQTANLPCPFCANHCKRTLVKFSNGNEFVTNNRCERGEILGDPKDEIVIQKLKGQKTQKAKDLFKLRQELLFKDYRISRHAKKRNITIGIPRVLSFWETMPFWTTFLKSMGFDVKLSDISTRKMYEDGLGAVASDTVCFPAKLVHGHLRNLAAKKVDRIFMPIIATYESQNSQETSRYMCAIVKGYSWVIKNSDNPLRRWNIPYDAPIFFWYNTTDRNRQLESYFIKNFGISKFRIDRAIYYADKAMANFKQSLQNAAQEILDDVQQKNSFAVVLASRPYQNDPLVNHSLSELFTQEGIPVLTADSIPGLENVDLSKSRLEIVNNFHARMIGSAILAAENPNLEFVQFVSFGCGHDAYLSDEIIRVMKEISGKSPLILKMDESDVQGPLRIRVRSFLQTIGMKRDLNKKIEVKNLPEPYKVKFTKQDAREKIVLVPNTSHAFSRIMAAAMATQGLKTVPLPVGRENAIRLGKKYVHNDICFPAQIVIGEVLDALESGKYDNAQVAVGTGKYIGDCRLTHYAALLRKALDDSGFQNVAIVTNDDADFHRLHPGFRLNMFTALKMATALPMIDVMEELLRKIRPYEKIAGSTEAAFEKGMDFIVQGISEGVGATKKGFAKAIDLMNEVEYDRTNLRPRVLIVGEYLLNFHQGANRDIELYLEKNGFEIIEARMSDVIQKNYFAQNAQIKENSLTRPLGEKIMMAMTNYFFEIAHAWTDKIAARHPLYKKAARLKEIAKGSDEIIYHTFDSGEGILIPGEIIHYAKEGCRNFIILQPFGCLPNHIIGRGVTKRLKELFPDAQILPLDYDPDVSFANIENRLQMLIMNAQKM